MPDLPPRRRRSSRPSWSEPIAERLTPAIKAFVITDAILYAFYVFVREVRPAMIAHVALGPGLWRGEVWQLVTSLFVHFDLLGFVFNVIGLWFVGAFIERTQGTRRFVTLFLVSGVLANVALAGIAHLRTYQAGDVFDGCSFAVLALFCAFGRIYGRAPTQVLGALSLQARHLALIFVGWGVVASLLRADWAQLVATLVAAAAGYLGAAPGGLREAWGTFRMRRLRRRYRVLDGGASPPRPPKKYLN
ncbi:MAG TPA: rhomboid family intramembrane serine protease [Polyangia bacterium]|nr:rhomboid family intramembrane serine protease [Polyangia bacterium]